MGAPVDKNLWGELEPEEGTYLTILVICVFDWILQKKKKNQRKSQMMRTRKKPLRLLMVFKLHQASRHRQE